jgi:hypothetical protein
MVRSNSPQYAGDQAAGPQFRCTDRRRQRYQADDARRLGGRTLVVLDLLVDRNAERGSAPNALDEWGP